MLTFTPARVPFASGSPRVHLRLLSIEEWTTSRSSWRWSSSRPVTRRSCCGCADPSVVGAAANLLEAGEDDTDD
jgi:hypothetical protein